MNGTPIDMIMHELIAEYNKAQVIYEQHGDEIKMAIYRELLQR